MGREVPFRGSRSHIHLHKPQEQMQTGLTNLFVSLLKLALQKDPHSGAHWAANCAFLSRGCIVTSTVQMNKQ